MQLTGQRQRNWVVKCDAITQYETSNGESSPRPWGCFHQPACTWETATIFPTSVGVFQALFSVCLASLPHVRGGVSVNEPPDIAYQWDEISHGIRSCLLPFRHHGLLEQA